MGRWQSKLQRVQHLSNLQKINASNIENHGPLTSPTAVLKTELEKQCARADDNAHKLHNNERYNMSLVPLAVASLVNQHDVTEEAAMDWEAAEDVKDADMED
ncbi:hypothetical protein L208DRAFT_1398441 [Tricholoma matsutake]|nr:hypothetical protein L208DRAFT_1398441 [Tricholoma matsutake 945]